MAYKIVDCPGEGAIREGEGTVFCLFMGGQEVARSVCLEMREKNKKAACAGCLNIPD